MRKIAIACVITLSLELFETKREKSLKLLTVFGVIFASLHKRLVVFER